MKKEDTTRTPSPITTPKLPPKVSSFDLPSTPNTTLPPPTPGAQIKNEPTYASNKIDQDAGKKKRGRPKGSLGKPKETKKVKNGKVDISHFAQPHPSTKPDMDQKYSLKMSPYSSSDGGSSHASLVAAEHCYSLPPSASPSLSSSPHDIHLDHDYCGKSEVQPLQSIQPGQLEEQNKKEQTAGARPVGRPRKDPNAPKAQYTKKSDKINAAAAAAAEKQKSPKAKVKKIDIKQHQTMVENFVPVSRYEKRTNNDEFDILCKFLTKGIDEEDVTYMRRAYSYLIQNDIPGTEILHQVHWVDHCATDRTFEPSLPKKRKRENDFPEMKNHETGCARTEGYYKIDARCKAAYKYHHLKGTVAGSHLDNSAKMAVAKMQNASREARSNQRRLLTAFGGATESDLLKFNQLKFRKKQLKFAKSAIHDWGLFAMEPIAADEMVIEYVGQMVRPSVADLRETKYEAIGIGSSYLFRIDMETIIDATKCGNLARFINHSCNVSVFWCFS
jgi:histone-lysine N-methyltransferase SETD1